MNKSEKPVITRTGDYLIIPVEMTLDEIIAYPFTPKIIKLAARMNDDLKMTLADALEKRPYLMPIFILADGAMERNKGDWSIQVGPEVEITGAIRIDLYGLESSFYEVRESSDRNDDCIYILAGVATVQNANVPDWRIVLGRSDGYIFRDRKLEGIIQGQRIQEARSRKNKVIDEYMGLLGDVGKEWLPLIEKFLNVSGL